MFTQRLPELGPDINEFGCALVSIAAAVSAFDPRVHVTPQTVRKTYSEALRSGAMRPKALIWRWADVFALLGLRVEYHGHMPRGWQPGEDEFEICKWTLLVPHEGINWQHFTFGGDAKRHPFFDPWGSAGPGYTTSRTVAEGVLDSKRGFRLL
jgi:hypothetical protein